MSRMSGRGTARQIGKLEFWEKVASWKRLEGEPSKWRKRVKARDRKPHRS